MEMTFFKGTKTIKQLSDPEYEESDTYQTNFRTDSSMRSYDYDQPSHRDSIQVP